MNRGGEGGIEMMARRAGYYEMVTWNATPAPAFRGAGRCWSRVGACETIRHRLGWVPWRRRARSGVPSSRVSFAWSIRTGFVHSGSSWQPRLLSSTAWRHAR